MIYTIERANLLIEQFRRFKSHHAHHLAGLYANVDFWLNEVQETYHTIDDYNSRFTKLRSAQEKWVNEYDTKVYNFCPACGGKCEFDDGIPSPTNRTSSSDLQRVRLELKEAAREFLLRCFRTGLVDEDGLNELCNRIGTSLEPSDLIRSK